MKTAGLVLDFYDDKTGGILKEVCPTPDRLPEAVKVAHILSAEERSVLRDEAFALILHNDGEQLRKFACVDEGNTVLSTLYFMETFDRLPPEAVKTAAQNLIAFNAEFGLPAPHLLKLAAATGMSRKRDSMQQPLVGDEADWAARTNLVSVRGGADSGRVIPTANAMKTASVEKTALIEQKTQTLGVPHKKVVEGLHSVGSATASELLRRKRLNAALPPQPGNLRKGVQAIFKGSSVVDVSALEPEFHMQNKTASRTALGDRFSLDSFSDVEDAITYFEEGWTAMGPAQRHEFSVKTAARAEELGIQVPELMARYGSTEYAPDIDAHLANRRAVAPQFEEVWNDLQEKRAMIEPESFASLLQEADELVGLNFEWGGSVMDPYFATFGGAGDTEKLAWAWEGADGEKIDEDGLKAISHDKLAETFSPDFVEAFAHDPVTIFSSMPDQHKVLISRMVAE
jgi:hypothetical protein